MSDLEKHALDRAFDRFEMLCQDATAAIEAFHNLNLNQEAKQNLESAHSLMASACPNTTCESTPPSAGRVGSFSLHG
jgi:hypothetical protein